ncbi:cytochrome-c oxidase, cbb3-type subunit II [bacterium]|nr:cytochrome-c oxidase, cbb3-type subunit II [bacterium]
MSSFLNTDGRHRTLEGWPLVFTTLTILAVLVGGTVEFLPLVLMETNRPTISTVTPYTPLELTGRDLYIREGCVSCHSQQIRPFRDEIERYGEYSKPGESIYDRPFLWGSKRTGPDLSRVGGKYPDLWHVLHLEDPRSTSPNSLMPPYNWLLSQDVNLDNLTAKMNGLRTLGTPYTDSDIEGAVQDAKAQASNIARTISASGGPQGLETKEIVAVIAYLQRMGTDLTKSQN